MKSCRSAFAPNPTKLLPAVALLVAGFALVALAAPPTWIQNIESSSAIEALLFRAMTLPGGAVLVRRPPAETVPALTEAIQSQSKNDELYSLRAMEEEQKEDFPAAEADWKLALQNAPDKVAAQLALADFYHRRLRPIDEVNALSALGEMPSPASERFTPNAEQQSWQAFERIFTVIQTQALGKDVAVAQYKTWLQRYPQESGLYGRYLEYLLAEEDYSAVAQLIPDYKKAFPSDEVFPVKARALLEYKQGSVEQGLAIYDRAFQPLWPAELVKGYFDLLKETHSERKFLDTARAQLAGNPDDLNAAARIFYYYQQQGRLDAAQQTLTEFRLQKEARNASWTAQELYTLARLLDQVHAYPEAARYYYALYNSAGMEDAQEQSLAGLTNILLSAPEQPVRLGSGELSIYKDIATADAGPGFLNGILSLILNTTAPSQKFSEEENRAAPYFHRARAAELLALMDQKFPNSARRPELHAMLIQAYSNDGESDAVIRTGKEFLAAFPSVGQRTQVALLMADAYARTDRAQEEFAIYDSVLEELARKADGVPLGENAAGYNSQSTPAQNEGNQQVSDEEGDNANSSAEQKPRPQAFTLGTSPAAAQSGPRSQEYARVLDRYIARLIALKRGPQALAVYRHEMDRNPNDPGLYERLAQFLEQNQLDAEQEAVYKRALQQFPDKSWYHKLARWYLRKNREASYEALSTQVIKTFAGTDLESYFSNAEPGFNSMALRLNQYANQRFPHNLRFVRSLMIFYRSDKFRDEAAWEALLMQHWLEDDGLRNQFFAFLSRTGKLDAELNGLRQNEPAAAKHDWSSEAKSNPAASRFIAEAELWQSHFEAASPVLGAVAEEYPADQELGERASSVFRSLAYFDGNKTNAALRVEQRLLAADPGNRDRLARIGDIYSDREMFAQAAPFWNKMPETAPGDPTSYLDAATVYWDYYDFENALRILREGRRKLKDENLYRYEAGAIYENQHEYAPAIEEYVQGALVANGDARCQERLLRLATRAATRDAVDTATASAATGTTPRMEAINLRVAVLETQNRKPDLVIFLATLLQNSTSLEMLESIESIAKEKSLESVRQLALERQAVVTSDPIRRLELRYALVNFYEGRKEMDAAQRNVEALYHENPKILGVVRATIDFYWRNKMQLRAIETTLATAHDSYPELQTRFTFEAARKMTEAGQYEAARKLLLPLLEQSPYNAEFLAAVADTYARAGDNAGLRDFYLATIELLRKSPLAEEVRKTRIAELRRGVIPALTILKDHDGAADQYIELLKSFPEDGDLTTEAATYAERYKRNEQLLQYFSKAVSDSPKDSRWPMVLGRLETVFEDFPAAIETYSKAIRIRPDRVDLLNSRATLEERLMRFDEAAADFAKLYELSYHDAKWMEKTAEIRARQGNTALTEQALKTAFLEGRPENANNYFEVARRLETWAMLSPALDFTQQGLKAAGDNLLADSQFHAGAQLYVRIMTRLRQTPAALTQLDAALHASTEPPSLLQQITTKGLAAITDSEARRILRKQRTDAGREGMKSALREMGTAVDRYFTPEEKAQFASLLESKHAAMSSRDVIDFLLPLAETAALPAQEVRWRFELLSANPRQTVLESRLDELQRRRLKLAELGMQIERLASLAPAEYRMEYVERAYNAYHAAGDAGNELRIIESYNLISSHQQRYFELLLASNPQRLLQVAAIQNTNNRDASANYILAHADAKLAMQAVAARGTGMAPVWPKAYTGLTGLYFADSSPQVQAAFLDALGDQTIGQRLGKPVDRTQQLAGDVWFYYGSRYGEYLGVTRKGEPEDFLPAVLEQAPASPAAYFTVAQYFDSAGDWKSAIADYQHMLELAPDRLDAHEHLALIYWRQKKPEAALAEWNAVLDILKKQAGATVVPETFWSDYAAAMDHIGTRRLFTQFRPQVEKILNAYVKRNGYYRLPPLLHSTFVALNDPAAASAWTLQLSALAPDPFNFLTSMAQSGVIALEQRAPVYVRILELAKETLAKSEGIAKDEAQAMLNEWQIKWLRYLLARKLYDRAYAELEALPQSTHTAVAQELVPLELQLAALRNTLDGKLDLYRSDAEHAPALALLRSAATELQQTGDKKSARKILEYVFSREIENHQLTAANMTGLAEIRIEDGDLEGALNLLRRMRLVVGEPFTNQDAAAALLIKTGHPAEAIPFLQELVQAVPWDSSYHIRLAQAQIAAGKDVEPARDALAAIAADKKTAYDLRSYAAVALTGSRPSVDLGSAELNLLALARPIQPSEANQPFFYAARMKAAEKSVDPQEKFLLIRAAIEDRPFAEVARLPLFHAALGASQYPLALTSLEPLLGQVLLSSQSGQNAGIDEEEDLSTSITVNRESWLQRDATALGRISPQQQAETAAGIGLAFEKVNNLQQAITYLRTAYRLETDSSKKEAVNQKLRELRAVLRREHANAARQPMMHEALEQDRIVHPRLQAKTTVSPPTSTADTRKQVSQ